MDWADVNTTNLSDLKKGYLKGDFAFFHLKDMKSMHFEYHYHDFSKIIAFISGNITYYIEGKAYRLKPGDILFVSSSEVHKLIIDPSVMYERIVIWINPDFLEKHSDECSLFTCFNLASERNQNLLRLDNTALNDVKMLLAKLEDSCKTCDFGSTILKNSIFMHLLITLTRELLRTNNTKEIHDIAADESIQQVLNYINANIHVDLSIDTLADKFFLNRYHLMHKFKQQTGYSVHSYILQKRLMKADTLMKSGMPAGQACEQSGFNDYSSFVRAFKKMFGQSPKSRIKRLEGPTQSNN